MFEVAKDYLANTYDHKVLELSAIERERETDEKELSENRKLITNSQSNLMFHLRYLHGIMYMCKFV